MRKGILFGLALVLVGCFMGSDEGGPVLLGYSTGGSAGSCGKAATNTTISGWELAKDLTGKEKFCVYGKMTDLNAGKLGTKTRAAMQSYPKIYKIIDTGGKCLTFEGNGAGAPAEPCFPYLLDGDIP